MSDSVLVPRVPSRAHLVSMAMRYRHDFGIELDDTSPMSCGMTDAERESILRIMAQLYEEATGQGFYKLPTSS